MTINEVKKIIDGTNSFKNTTLNFNKEKDICDIYTKCIIDQDDFMTKIKKIKKIEVVPCDFGIFELIIPIKGLEKTLETFSKTFLRE